MFSKRFGIPSYQTEAIIQTLLKKINYFLLDFSGSIVDQ